jgi:hypothetical protein
MWGPHHPDADRSAHGGEQVKRRGWRRSAARTDIPSGNRAGDGGNRTAVVSSVQFSPPAEAGSPSLPSARSAQLVPIRRTALVPAARPEHGARVALRQVVIATDPDDFGLSAWTALLDRIGSPYDVLYARSGPLEPPALIGPEGIGRYNAVLLTNGALRYQDAAGQYPSAFSPTSWATLWEYQRDFQVRQVSLSTAPGTDPEDYGLRPSSEGPVTESAVQLALTEAGAAVFDDLRPDIRIPISHSYLYRTRFVPRPGIQPLLTDGDDVLGVLATAPDGRERLAITFSLGPLQLAAELLGLGLLRWATRGLFLGEQRHWINVDVDDWFNVTTRLPGSPDPEDFRLSGSEALAVDAAQEDLRRRYPLAAGFTLNLAFNGRAIDDPPDPEDGHADGAGPDGETLTGVSRRLANRFRWINHTYTHWELTTAPYARSYSEISNNLAVASAIGLPVTGHVLKTPEYSGLGVRQPDPSQPTGQLTDLGLAASNPELLQAACDLGVTCLHGNMSYSGHRPTHFNAGVPHPLKPGLLVVPDWPTNIAFDATTPEEVSARYNAIYGANGAASDHRDRDLTYSEILDAEADVALRHLISGSAYSHTVHQANLHQYAPGRCVAFDWLTAVIARYSTLYQVPLRNPDWSTLAAFARARTAHFEALATGVDAVWDRTTNDVTYPATCNGSLFVTGLAVRPAPDPGEPVSSPDRPEPGPPTSPRVEDEAEIYGTDSVSRIGLTAGTVVHLVAGPGR